VTFEGSGSPGAISAVGFNLKPDAIALASDSFVLDLCRIVAPLQRENEMVLGRRVRSAVGVPFVTRGHVVGALVLMDREARSGEPSTFDEEDGRFLASLAALAAPALEALRQLRALSFDIDRLREENRALKGTLGVDEVLVGDSLPMRRVKDLIARAASSRANVLIRGESGTGKELAAKLLHSGSPRRDAPFLALNCAAVPEPLLESELFGIEKGVATGVEARMGKLELANGGTVFLDEIADARCDQAKLLPVLRAGSSGSAGSNIPVGRVLSATHADLSGEISASASGRSLLSAPRGGDHHAALRTGRTSRASGHLTGSLSGTAEPLSLSRDAVAEL
jgi:transcriptional regulator with GAF, ATPase, and Fis domain